jgi:hypothetical protein
MVLRIEQRGFQEGRTLEAGERRGRIALKSSNKAETIVGLRHLRVFFQSDFVFSCRSLEVAPSLEHESEEIVRGRQRGLSRHRLSKPGLCLVQLLGFQ